MKLLLTDMISINPLITALGHMKILSKLSVCKHSLVKSEDCSTNLFVVTSSLDFFV